MARKNKKSESLRRSLFTEFFVILLLVIAILVASIVRTANVKKQNASPDASQLASQNRITDAQSEAAATVAPTSQAASGSVETTLPGMTYLTAMTTLPGVSDTAAATGIYTTTPVNAVTSAPVASELSEDDKVVYLTFDDGPTDNTRNLLDILDRYGVKATFFVIHTYDGCEVQIKELYDRGQQIALHSYTHNYNIYRSVDTYFADLQQISDLVYNATGGYRSTLVRFPGGTSNTVSRKYCSGIMTTLSKELPARGYRYFDWDWDSTDAEANRQDTSVIVRNATKAIGNDNHVILLMHDAAAKTTTVEALPQIIEAYRSAGYRFDVLSMTSYTYQHKPNN
ncbi:MAG: polysaccharide deacetylase [Clostridia bacterium]|nr:polysaccharide deacetylase [Clostridia bacterium]